jgi:hypothetical protein
VDVEGGSSLRRLALENGSDSSSAQTSAEKFITVDFGLDVWGMYTP